jgi:multiple sugar transport system permease protein
VYRNAFEYLRYGYASAAVLTMFLATVAVVLVQYLVIRRWQRAFA